MPKSNRAREQRAREKIAAMRAAEARRKRRRLWLTIGAAAVVVIGAAVGITLAVTGGGANAGASHTAPLSSLGTLGPAPAPGPPGPENVPVPSGPVLAAPSSAVNGQSIDGISCQAGEQTVFHIHAHLTVFVNGAARQVPAAIGI